ncbi:neurogenic locus notch homolog protein 1-like [Ruditapes philippinarum]|uniref:neurogenic locus notch homolog protein 1-like n=1 Tax=Ruditapes philippinarum TaxID=129788 RepID=UPI00295C26C4|nr:neurogenic locus notch homolog protein 1-like [Ruditapes philippinarum]
MALRHGSFRQYNATFLLRIGEIVHSERLLNVLNGVLREGDCRIRNSSLDVAFENNSYFIFNDYDNKLCEFGSNGNCDKETTTCKQINGSTFCLCKEGFHKTIESMKYCTDIDECEIETCNNETCVNSYGNWSCQCKNINSIPDSNDRKNFTCKDVSVCEYKEYKNKNINFKCINGNRTCRSDTQKWECTCEKGLSSVYYDINTFKCEDVDECAETGDICSGHGTCKNKLNGNGYSCNCEKGYKENATNCFNVTCEDINECEASSNYSCLGGGNCNNTIGGWGCLCNAGYQATTISKFNISCEDIDECENNSYYCNGTCYNVMGNWTCTCLEGFRAQRSQNGTRILCIDIDECQENKNCSGHGSCENHPGRFECKCYDGFVFNSSNQTCIDIDECNKPKICGDGGNCTNTLGNYKCTCPKHGYVQQKYHNDSCKDINECTDESYYCGGDCNNTLGSWTCKCKQGYSKESNNETKISITCEDINECDKSAKCVDGVCINLDGSWSCDCQDGKQPERFNSTLTVCRGGFQYIMSTGISVPTSSDVKPKEINIYMKAQIEAIYTTKFHNQHVRVEIISVIRVDSGKRRKRQATESYEIDFVVHFNQSIPHENISQAWTEYIKHNCSTGSNVGCPAPKNVRALPVVFESKISITKDQSAALCNLDKYNHCDPDTSTCHFVNGSANCDCKKGYTKNDKQSNLTCEVSKDACQQSLCKNSGTCRMSQGNKSFECLCRDGWTGKYCEDVQVSKTDDKDDKTILIATTSSLGGLVIILALAMIILCRFKSKKSEDDKMSLKHMDANGFKSFDGALLRNRFVEDDDDGVGSYYSRRLSSSSMPYGHQNRLSGSGNQNGFAHNGLYASPNKLPRANIHGSMPNLAGNGTSFNHFDDRRYSGDEARHVLSYNQGLNRSYDIDLRAPRNNWNGRRSPPPDYGRPRSPKPDYHGRKFNRSKDSGVGNGNSSESNEYQRQENRGRHYYYGQRQSTNF